MTNSMKEGILFGKVIGVMIHSKEIDRVSLNYIRIGNSQTFSGFIISVQINNN